MDFQNNKKTFLAKLDKSKKGGIDEKVISLIGVINSKENYYTTSSCSGRVGLLKGSEKKNETEWLKVSHDLIKEDFFGLENNKGLVWLRLEPFIMHICCKDLESANILLGGAKRTYKKSCILSVSNKFIVEIRGSEQLKMPFYDDGELLFSGELTWLRNFINEKLGKIWEGINKFELILKELK
ncbi:hypothetical protein HOC13_01360 [Candidatus Woesearchaeota archaeon]|nr:hypothetical protein [Candidatus Woesearchaeota archaeon]